MLLTTDSVELLVDLVSQLKPFEQRKYLSSIIAFIVKQYFSSDHVNHEDVSIPASKTVCAAARLLQTLTKDSDVRKDHLLSLLMRSTLPSLDDSLAARRSVMAALAQDEGEALPCQYCVDRLTWIDKLHTLLESCIKIFGDSIYIKHTPVLQQECMRTRSPSAILSDVN